MSRPSLVFCAPILTKSGYGEHSRDLLRSLLKMDKYDISLISINWGETPMNALDAGNEEDKKILSLIRTTALTEQPDIWIQCTVPNEFQPVGKYNIGITAGIETDICSGEWVEGCNRMNLIIVPSKHAKDVFLNTEYDKIDKQSHQSIGKIKVNVPVEVLHEGVRLDTFGQGHTSSTDIVDLLNNMVKEEFAYLFVGHWLRGDLGQDRKDLSGLIMTFIKAFSNTENMPALLLKASSGSYSITDKSNTLKKIEMIRKLVDIPREKQPNIYLLHGDLTDNELNTVYNHDKVKALVSFTKGEGYGRPIAEFITTGKPVIVSGWSGHVDFVNPVFHVYLDGQLTPIHESSVWEGVLVNGARWFTVNYQSAAEKLRDVHKNYKKYHINSKKGLDQFLNKWSFDSMHEKFINILDSNVPKFAQKIQLNLPKLIRKVEPTIKAD